MTALKHLVALLSARRWLLLMLIQLLVPFGLAVQVRIVAEGGALGAWCGLLSMAAVLSFNQTVVPRMPPLDRIAAAVALAWALWAVLNVPPSETVMGPDPAALASLAVAAGFAAAALYAYLARRGSGRETVLRFPFDTGRLMALQAGSLRLINAHVACLSKPEIRGQSLAVDLVALGPLGLSARSLLPRRVEQFPIHGLPVLSPVAGLVTRVVDHEPDQAIGDTDRDHPLGNHVWLEWQDAEGPVEALLAHLAPGSICVHPGDRVQPGQRLGAAGNSGNTTEPHLHLHVQRTAAANPLEADPVPIRFEGIGVPYRNMLVDLRRSSVRRSGAARA